MEELPKDMLEQRGKSVTIIAFADASHEPDKITRRSHTGYVIFVNRAPIIFYSKQQSTVESSTFSSEFITMNTCLKHIMGLRFKLQMFGMDIDSPAIMLNDCKSAVKNSLKIEYTLNKKNILIDYHFVPCNVASRVVNIIWILTVDNIAGALTNILTEAKCKILFSDWTY